MIDFHSWWMVLWYVCLIATWVPMVFAKPRGQKIESSYFDQLPLYMEGRASSLASLCGLGQGAFILVRPRLFTLSVGESRAILLHELAHHRLGHAVQRLIWGSVSSFLLMMSVGLAAWYWWPMVIAIWWYSSKAVIGMIWRGQEYEADAEAVRLGADANALIAALRAITVDCSKRGPFHPSVEQRAAALWGRGDGSGHS